MEKSKNKIDVLVIVAHPDDESFLFAATSLKFEAQGKKVGVICATKGEKGADRLNRNLTKRQMATERLAELKQACKIMKVRHLEFLNYKDGELDQVDFKKLTTRLVKKIEQYQPSLLLTFGPEGISGHRDHIAIGKAAVLAGKQSKSKPKEIWLSSIPRSLINEFNEMLSRRKVHHTHFHQKVLKGVPDQKLHTITIGKYSDAKHKAIQAHRSQYLPNLMMKTFLTHEYFEVIKLS